MSNRAYKPSQRYPRDEEDYMIFLTGLSTNISPRKLEEYFKRDYPSVLQVEMKRRNKRNGKITGYAFLSLSNERDLRRILKKKHFEISGRTVTATQDLRGDKLKRFKNEIKQRRLFIAGVPYSFQCEDLEELLSRFGEIEQAFIVRDVRRGNISRGFGYVTFKTVKDAKEALRVASIQHGAYTILILPFKDKNQHDHQPEMGWEDDFYVTNRKERSPGFEEGSESRPKEGLKSTSDYAKPSGRGKGSVRYYEKVDRETPSPREEARRRGKGAQKTQRKAGNGASDQDSYKKKQQTGGRKRAGKAVRGVSVESGGSEDSLEYVPKKKLGKKNGAKSNKNKKGRGGQRGSQAKGATKEPTKTRNDNNKRHREEEKEGPSKNFSRKGTRVTDSKQLRGSEGSSRQESQKQQKNKKESRGGQGDQKLIQRSQRATKEAQREGRIGNSAHLDAGISPIPCLTNHKDFPENMVILNSRGENGARNQAREAQSALQTANQAKKVKPNFHHFKPHPALRMATEANNKAFEVKTLLLSPNIPNNYQNLPQNLSSQPEQSVAFNPKFYQEFGQNSSTQGQINSVAQPYHLRNLNNLLLANMSGMGFETFRHPQPGNMASFNNQEVIQGHQKAQPTLPNHQAAPEAQNQPSEQLIKNKDAGGSEHTQILIDLGRRHQKMNLRFNCNLDPEYFFRKLNKIRFGKF